MLYDATPIRPTQASGYSNFQEYEFYLNLIASDSDNVQSTLYFITEVNT